MATHRSVTAAKRWTAIAFGKQDTGLHIWATGDITSGTLSVKN